MNRQDTIHLIQTVLAEHTNFYDDSRGELRKYRDAYESKFWDSNLYEDAMIRVETADCFSYVEGFIASLFSRQPAVVVAKDSASLTGDAQLSQALVNRFLFEKREQIEIASRLALIYPSAFLKLSPTQSDDILEKVAIRALPAWEVIVDQDASAWNEQRYCGHTYYLPLSEAKELYGNKSFSPIPKNDYFVQNRPSHYDGKDYNLPDEYLYIQIVEFYDFSYDRLCIWSPNWKNGEELLVKEQIPLRTYDDKPMSPMCPLYYARKPEKPMIGLSAVARVYDQFYEKNILRTYWANAVRRDSRQYLYKEGAIDQEALAKITAGIDGAMIPIDEPTLEGVIKQVGVEPISTDFDRYLAQIEQDINRGSILAPFSRGEATKATATEITALAQYSASEIGKLARERDAAIENISRTYLRIIALLTEEGEMASIEVMGLPKVITPEALDAKFKIVALDQSSTPLSESIKRQNLIQLFPVLVQLGVDPTKIKEEVIRLYDFPKSFLEATPQVEAPAGAPRGGTEAPVEDPSGELPSAELARILTDRGGRV